MKKETVHKKPPAKVLVVDDHPVVRQGLAQLLKAEEDLVFCGGAEDPASALKLIDKCNPDIVVADLSLKDASGIELIKDIRIRHPKMPVLVLSMHEEGFYAERVLRAGARGYIMKETASDKVITAIRKVLGGEIYLSDVMAAKLLANLVEGRREDSRLLVERLSDRELEVFQLIGGGMGTRQIARQLHLSVKTIEAHRANIKRKLKLDSSTELLQHAIRWVQSETDGPRPL